VSSLPSLPRIAWRTPRNVAEARVIQEELAGRLVETVEVEEDGIRLIAGVDASISRDGEWMIGSICLLSWPDLVQEDRVIACSRVAFPYIPGYLSFREVPVLLEAAAKLAQRPDLALVDGHGIAHPRRLGLASHLGLVTGWRTVGCAKKRLVGICPNPGMHKGDWEECRDRGEVVGYIVRTRSGVKPVWVSSGYGVSPVSAREWVVRTATRYRLPDPIRCAHRQAGEFRRTVTE